MSGGLASKTDVHNRGGYFLVNCPYIINTPVIRVSSSNIA